MIGLEININGRTKIVAASDDFISLILTNGYTSNRIILKGGDILHYLTWLDGKPEVGDSILMNIVDTDEMSPVLTMENCDRKEIKARYERLRVELQEKGLI